jgi:GrpB-like predicted nucleotidyltransferase (UPF0157 family)
MPRSVVLVDHDPKWHEMATEEARRVSDALGPEVIAIHHIGSTAIPGIRAKPVLDFLVYVRDLEALDANRGKLEAVGYVARGEFGIPGRRYYVKDTHGKRTHQLHCFLDGDPEGERHRLFRDYLRAHPDEASAYERLKMDMALRFGNDTNVYADAKTDYIRGVERKARAWRERGAGGVILF